MLAFKERIMIIGISGRKNAGKDTVAKMICNGDKDARILSFADPIRQIGSIFGFTENQMLVNKSEINKTWLMTWRKFAQTIGTDLFRNKFNNETWLRIADFNCSKYPNATNIVFQDCRFNNEAIFIRKKAGYIINVCGEMEVKDTHESEKGVSEDLIDFKIFNAKDRLDNTKSQVDVIMQELQI